MIGGHVGWRLPHFLGEQKSETVSAVVGMLASESVSIANSQSSLAPALVNLQRNAFPDLVVATGSVLGSSSNSIANSSSELISLVADLLDSQSVGLEDIFNYSGDLASGDIVEIDARKLLVELNDTNARKNFSGDYPIIPPGNYTFTYQDDESSRTVEIEIKKEDLHV